jgi:DNA-damage-inducible protein J
MADTTNLNIRIDKDLKEQAEIFFGELGLNMTTAFIIFVRQSLLRGKIPFEIALSDDPFYSISNIKALRQSQKELDEGKIVSKTMDELKAMEK